MIISNSWRIKLPKRWGKGVDVEGTEVVQCFRHSNTQTKIEEAALAVSSVLVVVVNKGS